MAFSTGSRSRHFLVTCAMVFIASFAFLGVAQNRSLRDLLTSKDQKDRASAIADVMEKRRRVVEAAVDIVQDDTFYKTNPAAVTAAMRVLGGIRAREAVGILAERLDFQDKTAIFPSEPYHILNKRDAVEALVQIGEPSISPVLKEALRTDKTVRHVCAASVVERILGKEVGTFLLQRMLEKEGDPGKKGILELMMREVQRGPGNYW